MKAKILLFMILCLSSLCVMGFTDDPPQKKGKVQGIITRNSTRKTEPKKQQTTASTKPKTTTPAAKPQAQQTPKINSKPQQKQPLVSAPSGYENGHGYVDLGLSVKWATTNVGASSPTDHGSYFAWGETRAMSDYSLSIYSDSVNGSSSNFNKYATNKKTPLDLSADAARANWGGSWRMPTRAEQDELRQKCTWTWTTQNGIKGYKVSSKLNGNTIFLPAAGHRINSDLDSTGSDGFYWSSSLNRNYPNDAFYLFVSSAKFYFFSELSCRCEGRSVRAVCPG